MSRLLIALLPLTALTLTACNGKGDDTGLDSGAVDLQGPDVSVESDLIDFGTVEAVLNVYNASLSIENLGDDTLTITNVEVPDGGDVFNAEEYAFQIQAGQLKKLLLYFYPKDYLAYEDVIILTTDDPDTPTIEVTVRGEVIGDADGDGFLSVNADGDDCDDSDPDVYPGAPEVWYDGIDANCDGLDDYDQDGDGFQTDVINPDVATGGGDCNDVWDDIYPGAEDAWYDGVDADCSGGDDWDADGDGWASAAYDKGDDCDDSDANVYPDAPERLNGVLDDCNGEMDRNISAGGTDIWYHGGDVGHNLGSAVGAADVDGDGIGDLFVGLEGHDIGEGGYAYVLSGFGYPTLDPKSLSGGIDYVAGATVFEDGSDSEAMGSDLVLLRDWDGDGPALALGSDEYEGFGRILVLNNDELRAGSGIINADLEITGTSGHYYVGRSLAGPTDLDGDGADDIIYEYRNSTSDTQSYIGLVYGGVIGSIDAASSDARFTGGDNNSFGEEFTTYNVLTTGYDLNGDGYDDWVYCDPLTDEANTNDGSIWALWGGPTRYNTNSATSFVAAGGSLVARGGRELDWNGLTCAIHPDADGDGDGELGFFLREDGIWYVVEGSGSLTNGAVTQFDATVGLEFNRDWEMSDVHSIGDWTDDGVDEWGFAFGGNAAAVFLYDPVSLFNQGDVIDAEEASIAYLGSDSSYGSLTFGWALSKTPADIDGDGRDDLITSDPGWEWDIDDDTIIDPQVGAVYVYPNTGL